jgi:hypothetical protein
MAGEPTDELWPMMSGLHRVLLHLAGRMPDDWMIALRKMVGDYEVGYLPDTISGGVANLGVALPAEDVALLRRVRSRYAGPEPPAGLDLIPIVAQLPRTAYQFAPSRAGDAAEDGVYDGWAEVVASTEPAVVVLRRTWRTDPAAATPPTRIYLVEVDPGAQAWVIGQDVKKRLDRSRQEEQPPPQIEVYWTGEDLPPYHRAALAGSMVVWQRPAGPEPAAEPARDLVDRLVDAARHRRFDDMRRLIDWPLTGAPRVALQLTALDPEDREYYGSGLVPGLFTAGESPEQVERVLSQVAYAVGSHPTVSRPEPRERQDILDRLRVSEVPEQGLSGDLLTQLAQLRRRSAELSEVYLVSGGSVVFPVAWAPDSDRLVLLYE